MRNQINPLIRLWRFLFYAAVLALVACSDNTDTISQPVEEGRLILDSVLVLDQFNFDSAACAEVLPTAFINSDTVPPGTLVRILVRSTACYSVHISIEDSAGKVVRQMDRYFKIYNRKNGDKNIAVAGYLPWDGLDDSDQPLPLKRYLWRMNFNFGHENRLKYRADIRLD